MENMSRKLQSIPLELEVKRIKKTKKIKRQVFIMEFFFCKQSFSVRTSNECQLIRIRVSMTTIDGKALSTKLLHFQRIELETSC